MLNRNSEFGIKQAKTGWVFILDADERMTEELADGK